MVTQKSRFNFFLTDMFINCLDLLSLFFRHSVYLWAIQSFICTVRQPLRICLSLTLTCQSISLKSGSQTLNQAVIPWVILCSVTVSQSVILCSVSVSQSVSHFMFSHCQSVSPWVILCSVIVSQSVSHCVILCSVIVSQSVTDSFYVQSLSVSQSVTESFYVQSLSVSHLYSVSVSQWVKQSVSESFYVQ